MAQDDPIQRNFVVLSGYLDMSIVPYLRNQDMLTPDEYHQLTNQFVSDQQKKEQLLILLPRKGKRYFEKFSKCLVWSGQAWLAKQIGIDVASIPPSPYPASPPPSQPSPEVMYEKLKQLMAGSQVPLHHSRSTSESFPPVHCFSQDGRRSQSLQLSQESLLSRPLHHATLTSPPQPPSPSSQPTPPSPPSSRTQPSPPSPRTQPSPTTHHSQLSQVPQAAAADGRPDPKVLVMYYKETSEFCQDVRNMVDMLTYIGGARYTLDLHLPTVAHPRNWNIWMEKEIEDSNFVLLVCSRTLHRKLQDPTRAESKEMFIEMDVARCFSLDVYRHLRVSSRKFIPVYLNQHVPQTMEEEWVPGPLEMAKVYRLDIDSLVREMDVECESEIAEKIGPALSRFEDIRHLVAKIRGQAISQPPRPIHPAVPLPSMETNAAASNDTQSSEPENIPERVLQEVVDRIDNWQRLGIQLGVQYSYLERLRRQYPNDMATPALEMFKKWREKKGRNATKDSLREALKKCGYLRLASEL